MRNITLNIEENTMAEINELIPPIHLQSAIGRLSTWNMTGFDTVLIWASAKADSRECEFTAIYSRSIDGGSINVAQRYVIGAIWHHDTTNFSFHS